MVFKRIFGDAERARLVKALGECRKVCTDEARHMPLSEGEKGAVYRANTAFLNAVDDYVEVLTGNREHFWMKLW